MSSITYFVAVRVLGGDWKIYGGDRDLPIEYDFLEDAMGMAATLRSSIKETLVGAIVSSWVETSEGLVITREYRNIEYLPPL